MVRKVDRRQVGPSMRTGRRMVEDDMRYRRMTTDTNVRRRLRQERRLERIKCEGVRILHCAGPMVRWDKILQKKNMGKEDRIVTHLVLKMKMSTVIERKSGGRMKRMTQETRGSQ